MARADVSWLGAFFAVGFGTFLLWAAVGTYLSATLRSYWPQLYAMAGSPTAADFWWHRTLPNDFDRFTLSRRFRSVGIDNRDLLLQFEIAFWARWLSIAAFIGFAISLALLAVGGHQP